MVKEFKPFYYETFYQVRNSAIVIYDQPANAIGYKRHELTAKTYSGNVTSHSAKRIRKATDLLVQIATPQAIFNPIINRTVMHSLSFITLTISGKERHITAKEGHELLLSKWLLRMKRKAGMKTYIWKAELQKNGQLHYHITTPSWINYTLIRDEWNTLLRKNGLATTFDDSTGKIQNSTDIHAVYKVEDMSAYLCKYLSKVDEEKSTEGKIWDCSLNLKCAKFFTIPQPLDFMLTDKDAVVKDSNRCTMIFLKSPIINFNTLVQRKYSIYLNAVRNYNRELGKNSFTNRIVTTGTVTRKLHAPPARVLSPVPVSAPPGPVLSPVSQLILPLFFS